MKNKDSDKAAAGFLNFLKEGRSVLLQDLAVMLNQLPDYPLWKEPFFARIFARPDFLSFQQQVLQHHHLGKADQVQSMELVSGGGGGRTCTATMHRQLAPH